MPELQAFRGIRYHPLLFPDLGQVVAPPYDVIGRRERQSLLARHDRNVVRLVLGFEEAEDPATPARYASAARTLAEWLAEGTLIRDSRPCLYGYAQRFSDPLDRDGRRHERTGFIGRVRLEPWGRGIHPHERTLAGPKTDRLRLLRATRARLDPIFGLISDPAAELLGLVRASRSGAEAATWTDETGIEHALWPIADPAAIASLRAGMAARDIVIADGHHRYETALAFRDERVRVEAAAPVESAARVESAAAGAARGADAARGTDAGAGAELSDYVLMYLAAMEDPALLILPVHRILAGVDADELRSRLATRFRVERLAGGPQGVAAALAANRTAIGFLARGEAARLVTPAPGAAPPDDEGEHPAAVVDREILGGLLGWGADEAVRAGRLRFATDWRETAAEIEKGEVSCAFLLPPTPVAAVAAAARAGRTLPQKSTYFYPKIPSGLVFDLIDA